MNIKDILGYYLRSKLNIFLSALFGAALIIAVLLLQGPPRLIVPIACAAAYLAAGAVMLLSGRGAGEIINVRDEDRSRRIRRTIERCNRVRDRISRLRLGDEEVRRAVEYFLLVSGGYLEKCGELSAYSPQANNAIDEACTVCQLYLEELDESSTEKRYQVSDPRDFTGFKQKTLDHLMSLARTIKEKTTQDLEGLSREDRFKVMEELDE
jgi:hypothetical protein